MKYRFSSLDQLLYSSLFDFSASYQPPKRTDRSTRSTRLGDMDFEAARAPYDPEDDALPLLADLFHLLFAQELRLTRSDERDVYVRLVQSAFVDDLLNADILFITDGRCAVSDGLAGQLQETIQNARCTVICLLLDADSPGMEFSLARFCEQIIKVKKTRT